MAVSKLDGYTQYATTRTAAPKNPVGSVAYMKEMYANYGASRAAAPSLPVGAGTALNGYAAYGATRSAAPSTPVTPIANLIKYAGEFINPLPKASTASGTSGGFIQGNVDIPAATSVAQQTFSAMDLLSAMGLGGTSGTQESVVWDANYGDAANARAKADQQRNMLIAGAGLALIAFFALRKKK